MNQRSLVATAVFYCLFSIAIFSSPASPTVTRGNIIADFAGSLFARLLFGIAMMAAGIFTASGAIAYDNQLVKLIAVGLRAGSMSAVAILALLLATFTSDSNLLGVLIFGYLAILTVITVPPPLTKTLDDAIKDITRDSQRT